LQPGTGLPEGGQAGRLGRRAVGRRGRRCAGPGGGAKSRSIGNRLAQTGDIAPLAAFLCTEQASWITAQTIRVNGGIA
jgi:NAD(P)-dependent dehydrogenase (short-subunit alcohol dehydrogenase family)